MRTRRAEPDGALSWPPEGRKFRLLSGILLVLFAAYAVTFFAVTASRMSAQPSGDFFALWSAGRFVLEHPAREVYEPAALKAAQLALGMDPGANYPLPYPPTFLLALAPLGLLPYLPAYLVAIGVTLVLYVWATVGEQWRSPMTVAALVMPTTTITIVAGQAGFLAAALLVGGFRLAARRPVLSGILFGLATYKPQLGVLVPVALIAARQWLTVLAACATVIVLILVTSGIFGPDIWPAWVANIFQYSGQFAAESSAITYLMPTVAVALARFGAAPAVAETVQLAAGAIAAYAVWRCFRPGPSRLAAAALFAATFLATPHAFVYDMPLVATAVLWMVAERQRAGDAFGTGEIIIMALALLSPITLVAGKVDVPLALLSLVLLLGMSWWRCERLRARAAGG